MVGLLKLKTKYFLINPWWCATLQTVFCFVFLHSFLITSNLRKGKPHFNLGIMFPLARIIHRLHRRHFLNGITFYKIFFSYENRSHLLQMCSEKSFI